MSALSLGRRLGSNFFWSGLGESGSRLLLLLFHIYTARVLSVENFGLFSLAQTVVTYFWLAVDLGVNYYGPREIAKDRAEARGIINSLLGLRLFSGLAVFAVFSVAVFFLISGPSKRAVFMVCAVYLVTRGLSAEWALRGLEWFRKMAVANFASFAFMLAAAFLLVKGRDSVLAASAVWALGYLAGAVVMLFYLNAGLGISVDLSPAKWLAHIKGSVQFTFASSLTILYYYLPVVFIGAFGSDHDVGMFSAPFRLLMSATFVITAAGLAIFPVMADLHHNDKAGFKKLMRRYHAGSAAFGALALAVFVPAAPEVIGAVYGQRYMDGVSALRILAVFVCVVSLKMPFQLLLAASGRQNHNTIAAAGAIGSYALLFFSALAYGAPARTSAALSLPMAEAVSLVYLVWVSRRKVFYNNGRRPEIR